jgi:hypothetical protein
LTGHFRFDDEEPQTAADRQSRSHEFIWTLVAIVSFVSAFTIVAAMTLSGGDDEPAGPLAVAAAVTTPIEVTVTPEAASPTPAVAAATQATTPEPTTTASPPPTASSISATPIVDDGAWSATPVPTTTPADSLTPVAQALAESIESQYGVRILTAGQDWGADKDLQLRNIGAVGDALAGLPLGVRTATAADRPLAFLSNHTGMTEAGWEPYGARETNYYSNEDVSTNGRVAANEVVLQPGSNSQTITHEIMHAYQMRGIAPGQYALALLTPEMKSFMQATGWTQLVSDDEVRAAAGGGWSGLNALFQYNGRPLTYSNEFGDSLTLFAPNPLEAYAEAGGLYYGHSTHMTLPEWPEYWDWFQAHVG